MKQDTAELIPFFRRVQLLGDLDEGALTGLARASHCITVPRGCVLFTQDDPAEAAYLVRSGKIAIVLNTPDGRELVINEMRAGDCFGELALMTGERRSASAVAREPSELVMIARSEFMAEIKTRPAVMARLMETLARRLRSSTEREGALAFMDAPARLAKLLLQVERIEGAEGYLTISQEELAQRIGITRQTTAKILGSWRRKGWIITGRGKLMLVDRAALRRVASNEQKNTAAD